MTRQITAAAVLAASVATAAQSIPVADVSQTFEVATVKRNVSGETGGRFGTNPDRSLNVTNYTLYNIVRNAYGVQRYQIVPGTKTPDWFDTIRWNIVAKPPSREATQPQMMGMVRNLLTERFKLVTRQEMREIDAYALVLDRADRRPGPQLRPSNGDCAAVRAALSATPAVEPPPVARGYCGSRGAPGNVATSGIPIADFARNLASVAGRLVIDRTGLTGPYDLDLQWTPDQQPVPGAGPGAASDGVSLFAALREQLGLKLEPTKTTAEVLVIDAAELPVED
jgi:uncharacterized protein (TIGR03435 family)